MLFFSYFDVLMGNEEYILEYEGHIDLEIMEELLNRLRDHPLCAAFQKAVRKRLYGTVVECIDNIYKYSAVVEGKARVVVRPPFIRVMLVNDQLMVSAGNLIENDHVDALRYQLERVNQLDQEALKSLYEEVINRESSASDTGAGLGLITMALRTNDPLAYEFIPLGPLHTYFIIQIIIKT